MSNEQDYLEIDLSELRQLPEAERVSRLADHLWAMNEFLSYWAQSTSFMTRDKLCHICLYRTSSYLLTSHHALCDVCEGLTEVRDSLKAK